MPDLLLHSMSEFADIILAGLDIADARAICEIGAEFGGMTQRLAERAARTGGSLTSIDPTPQPEFLAWAAASPHLTHLAEPSLAALEHVAGIDAWLVDGDHNWFTVYHELTAIERICRRDARPMLVFLHDIGWPAGRRDMYYAPERIPLAFRHPHDRDGASCPAWMPPFPAAASAGWNASPGRLTMAAPATA